MKIWLRSLAKKWAFDIVHKKRAIQSIGSLDNWQLSHLERNPGTESIQLSSPEGITLSDTVEQSRATEVTNKT